MNLDLRTTCHLSQTLGLATVSAGSSPPQLQYCAISGRAPNDKRCDICYHLYDTDQAGSWVDLQFYGFAAAVISLGMARGWLSPSVAEVKR